ncbi:UPF0280 family protein [Dehalogenimonas alkenigignens]|uniref:Uncharacterized protein n=1 Tax=Dehalogenimonas alkenigignens TaxID=1217799 RepID=A0A0W0GIZ4_9CHLR|nr:UPF0280 family protein [Dehalogenimonas alkenigignens]KTB48498.1 hypothetical protein DEALK_13440 [Dehalogenimonas alkenigignens]PVV85053.1 UPF0280 family protein [Dehalogenimonas alkenigignens]
MSYQPRFYRSQHSSPDLISFSVCIKETNLFIAARCNLERKAYRSVQKYRQTIEGYIARHPEFLTSLAPVEVDPGESPIICDMAEAAQKAGVGPMAAVAGAIAESVGRDLLEYSSDIIVENGGDLFIRTTRERVVGIQAGDSLFSGKLGLTIKPTDTPCGICTSSGTVGHSLSFGKADAVTIVAASASLADAAATACCNCIQSPYDINKALSAAQSIEGVSGAIIIMADRIGAAGDVRLVRLSD